jgi:hypothetical protein
MVSFKATEVDIEVQRRDSPVIPVTVQDQDGVAIDITGASFLMTADPEPFPADALANLFQISGTIITPAAGRVDFQPTTGDLDVAPNTYFYDIQMTLAGSVRTILKGKFTVEGDITI